MSDDDSNHSKRLPAPVRLPGRAIGRVRRIAKRGRGRLAEAIRSRADDAREVLRKKLLEFLSSPEQVESLQRALARIGGWSMKRGFDADPNAELLFSFVDWLEQRHGRPAIASILFDSSLVRDPSFVEAIAHLGRALSPAPVHSDDDIWDAERVERFKDRAGQRLLELLVQLAALERQQSPPQTTEDRIVYFESAPIPDRFKRLATMTQGRDLIDRPRPRRRIEWAKKAKKLVDRLRSDPSEPTEMRRFVPGVGDETLHFLVFSTGFFLQSYILRGMVEALPSVAADIAEQAGDDEMIDIDE